MDNMSSYMMDMHIQSILIHMTHNAYIKTKYLYSSDGHRKHKKQEKHNVIR